MPSSKAPRRLQDIIDNAQAIISYADGTTTADFEKNRLVYDAVERCLERISEALAKLGDLAPVLMPDQPWYKIRALGNVLRHEYDHIEEAQLFEFVKTDLPSLLTAAKEALRRWESFRLP